MKSLLGVSEASYLGPLLFGLKEPSSPFDLLVDFPAETTVKLQERIENLRCAFLSPIDYTRHGTDYRIVPDVCVSSIARTDTILLYINPGVRNINSVAVDVRVTSEIILAKIIIAEKFPNLSSSKGLLQFIPMAPNLRQMLKKADAALLVNLHPREHMSEEPFGLDLVEEWNDLTGLPYVHGFWVGYDSAETERLVPELIRDRDNGIQHLDEIAEHLARQNSLSAERAAQYLSSFSYRLAQDQKESLSEFTRYAYYHGVIPDIPDVKFFEINLPSVSLQ